VGVTRIGATARLVVAGDGSTFEVVPGGAELERPATNCALA
jgi:hypothetical protein